MCETVIERDACQLKGIHELSEEARGRALTTAGRGEQREGWGRSVCYMTHCVLWLEKTEGRKDGGGADERQDLS